MLSLQQITWQLLEHRAKTDIMISVVDILPLICLITLHWSKKQRSLGVFLQWVLKGNRGQGHLGNSMYCRFLLLPVKTADLLKESSWRQGSHKGKYRYRVLNLWVRPFGSDLWAVKPLSSWNGRSDNSLVVSRCKSGLSSIIRY